MGMPRRSASQSDWPTGSGFPGCEVFTGSRLFAVQCWLPILYRVLFNVILCSGQLSRASFRIGQLLGNCFEQGYGSVSSGAERCFYALASFMIQVSDFYCALADLSTSQAVENADLREVSRSAADL